MGEVGKMDTDIELMADEELLGGITKLPDDGTLSPLWVKYIESLTNSVKAVSKVLRDECHTSGKSIDEVKKLRLEVEKLRNELEISRQWQNTVYADMQSLIKQYQQYYQSMIYGGMYAGYHPGSNPTLPNDVHSFTVPPLVSATTTYTTTTTATTTQEKPKVVVADAMPYGDSTRSKTIAERKRYRQKASMHKSSEINNCNTDVEVIQIKDENECNGENSSVKVAASSMSHDDMEAVCNTSTESPLTTETSSSAVVAIETTASSVAVKTQSVKPTIATKNLADSTGNEPTESPTIETPDKSIEETLREAAQAVVSKTGFTYDETSGLYYDWNLKMYYDPATQLYFDHENGIYYYYDTEKKSYIFHSQVEVEKSQEKKIVHNYDSDPSDGEIISDTETDKETISGSEMEVPVELCIRAVVIQSDTIDLGTLFVITYKGGTIGRDPTCTICIPECRVSRVHNYIVYDEQEKTFYIQDNQTQNGTFLNKERIAETKTPSEPIELTHRDVIKVGETSMSFHVHSRETCHDCEPGNIQAAIAKEQKYNDFLTREDLLNERKQQTKNMRKKYGINPGYLPKSIINSTRDRAGQRRKEHGIEAYEDTEQPVTKASVVKEIPSDNKGHKMLEKMGWKSGEGLGRSGTGIVNPITVSKVGRGEGLGSGVKTGLGDQDHKKLKNLEKTRQRYNKCK